MVWTAPMTAVSNAIFTAAQFNTNVTANLMETVPYYCTSAVTNGSYFVKTGTNSINGGQRCPTTAETATLETRNTANNTYADLSTVGPTVTVTTGTMALVIISCTLFNSALNGFSGMSFEIDTGSVLAAADTHAIVYQQPSSAGSADLQCSFSRLITGLTPGSHQFRAKYRNDAAGGTSTFSRRYLTVLPF